MNKHLISFLGMLAISCLCLVRAPSSWALDPQVKDDGMFFTDTALSKANDQIKEIKKEHGKDLMIETFAGIPEDRGTTWEAARGDPAARKAFFTSWLEDRAKKLGVDGVYVLIVKDPGHLEVMAGKNTRQKAFTQANQDKLSNILLDAFKAKNYDEGLQKAVDYFGATLKSNLGGVKAQTSADTFGGMPGSSGSTGSTAPPRSGSPLPTSSTPAGSTPPVVRQSAFNGSTIMWIILVIIAAMVIVRILSRLSGPRNYGGGPGYGPGQQGPGYGGGYGGGAGGGGGGGGFFRNILGGMVGGAAGSYFYDRMAHRNDPNNPNQSNPGGGVGGFPGSQDTGGSSGGDFGSSSSGGDFSSGSSGGGSDFGSMGDSSSSSGGDFGGGGDSSGGGGGGGGGGDSGGSSGGDF